MKKEHLKLSEADEKYLTEFLRKGQAKGRVMRRVTARLQLNQGATLQAVAETLKVAHGTVSTWWSERFVREFRRRKWGRF